MKTKLYRIYTENVNRQDVEKIVDVAFTGSTTFVACGRWQGKAENSLVVEIIGTEADERMVVATANAIKHANSQQAVLVVTLDVESRLV